MAIAATPKIVAACGERTVATGAGGGTAEADRCASVPQVAIDALEEGLTVVSGSHLSRAATVKSRDYMSAHSVSAEIDGPGIEGTGDIGTWVTDQLDGRSGFFAVNSVANVFSDWGDGRRISVAFSMSNDGARESRDCVR